MLGGMGRGIVLVAAAAVLACSIDRPADGEAVARREISEPISEGAAAEDPRLACMREHALDPARRQFEPVVRALCAELHDLRGVSASVAIVRDDRLVFGVAVGPRCHGRDEPLRVDTRSRIGSITKLVTTALALAVAERTGTSLDEPLATALPELSPAPTLRELMTHTSGLRDPDPGELLARGDAWPEALQEHREAAGGHGYANANFLLVGRWLERSRGRSYAELVAEEPGLAAVRALVGFGVGDASGSSDPACGHRPGPTWAPVELASEPPLPAWTLAAGGGVASGEALARLPFALERTGVLPKMLATRVPSDQPGWDYGLGIRMRGEDDALVLAHSGNTGTHWAELQWSPKHRIAVAVVSSTPQAYKATLHAAFTAALAEARGG
jgi:CubicO group peptidase (beta-lactamase class C family)